MAETLSGYASPDIFKPSATRTQMLSDSPNPAPVEVKTETSAAPAETPEPVETPVIPETKTETPITETRQEVKKEPEQKPVEAPLPPAPVIPPAPPKNPLEDITMEQVAAFYKSKREELLRAIGLDDFSVDAIKYYEATGGLAEYAAVKSVDYSKLSDDAILRRGLRDEFSHLELQDEEMELLYETRIKDRFKLDDAAYSEREVKAGKLEMKLEADKLRKAYIEKQKKFTPPERKPESEQEAGPSAQEQAAAALRLAMSDDSVKQFINGKKLVLGSGDQTYNYEFEKPQELLDILFDPNQYALYSAKRDETGKILTDKDGNYIPDYARLLKAVAMLRNGDEYEKMLINYGKSLGTKEVVDTMENPTTNTPNVTTKAASIWQAMKEQGVRWS